MRILYHIAIIIGFIPITNPREQPYDLYIIIAEECPICNYMGKSLSELPEQYKDLANFHLVFPLKISNYKTINLFKKKYNLISYESILDKDQSLTKRLGATVTPEAVITNKEGKIIYRGRVNDSFSSPGKINHTSRSNDLKNILDDLQQSQKINSNWNEAIGCFITFYQ